MSDFTESQPVEGQQSEVHLMPPPANSNNIISPSHCGGKKSKRKRTKAKRVRKSKTRKTKKTRTRRSRGGSKSQKRKRGKRSPKQKGGSGIPTWAANTLFTAWNGEVLPPSPLPFVQNNIQESIPK